jgi:hypothetical protein
VEKGTGNAIGIAENNIKQNLGVDEEPYAYFMDWEKAFVL